MAFSASCWHIPFRLCGMLSQCVLHPVRIGLALSWMLKRALVITVCLFDWFGAVFALLAYFIVGFFPPKTIWSRWVNSHSIAKSLEKPFQTSLNGRNETLFLVWLLKIRFKWLGNKGQGDMSHSLCVLPVTRGCLCENVFELLKADK